MDQGRRGRDSALGKEARGCRAGEASARAPSSITRRNRILWSFLLATGAEGMHDDHVSVTPSIGPALACTTPETEILFQIRGHVTDRDEFEAGAIANAEADDLLGGFRAAIPRRMSENQHNRSCSSRTLKWTPSAHTYT
jgi:hypothetical protein